MEYECKIIPATRLTKGVISMQKPLCTHCVNKTCTNPIIDQKISIMGVVNTSRLFKSGDRFFFVTQCDGFLGVGDEI